MTSVKQETNNIIIEITTCYEKLHSKVNLYTFSYKVLITNNNMYSVKIKRRSFIITDALFNIEYVEEEGINGLIPIIKSHQYYEYKSFYNLKTNFGSVKGYYTLSDELGNNFKAIIPELILAHPYAIQ